MLTLLPRGRNSYGSSTSLKLLHKASTATKLQTDQSQNCIVRYVKYREKFQLTNYISLLSLEKRSFLPIITVRSKGFSHSDTTITHWHCELKRTLIRKNQKNTITHHHPNTIHSSIFNPKAAK